MNTNDRIITALTPGSIFNRNGKAWRSLQSLAQFAGIEESELIDLLNGDMAPMVTCKPSTQGKGILVALTEHISNETQEVLADPEGQFEVEVEATPVDDEGNAPA